MPLSDFSVKFGRDPSMGLEGQKAFPFIYSLINHNDDKFVPAPLFDNTSALPASPTTGERWTAQTTANGWVGNLIYQWNGAAWVISPPSMGGCAVLVPANGMVSRYVVLDPDYNYKLLALKYSAYYWDPSGSTMYNYVDQTALISEGMDPDMDKVGNPVSHFISAALFVQGSGSQCLYGGPSLNPNNNLTRLPIPLDVIEGYDYGFYTVRTPYLCPRQGILYLELTNTKAVDLYVAAAIYGMKVRL
jgi:hypothetical protein